jgi:hypothetical protein
LCHVEKAERRPRNVGDDELFAGLNERGATDRRPEGEDIAERPMKTVAAIYDFLDIDGSLVIIMAPRARDGTPTTV